MKTLKNLLNQPRLVSNQFVGLFGAVSLLGFLDAAYLTLEHYLHRVPPCTIVHGCAVVTTSAYSTILGVPVALLGTLYYVSLLVLVIGYFDTKRTALLNLAFLITPLGLVASLYFLSLQMFVLHAYCLYCLGSIVTSTLLFALGIKAILKFKN